MSFVHDIRRAELIASLVHDIGREEIICIDYFLGNQNFAYLGTQDFAYERGRDEAAARGLAAVGKLTDKHQFKIGTNSQLELILERSLHFRT